MQLSQNSLNRFVTTDRRFARLQENFGRFIEALTYFSDPQCPLRGVEVNSLGGGTAIEVKYRNILLRFDLMFELAEDDNVKARMVCSQPDRSAADKWVNVGSFGFTFSAVTDIQTSDGLDNAELIEMAPDIVLEFIRQAVRASAP